MTTVLVKSSLPSFAANMELERVQVFDMVKTLWFSLGLPESTLSSLNLRGDPETSIESSFRVGAAAQTSIALSGLSAARFHELRTNVQQNVTVDARHASLAFLSQGWYTLNGSLPKGEVWDTIAGLYPTKGGKFVRIHTNFPHHRRGILEILRIPDSQNIQRSTVADALSQWNAFDFETEAASRGMCATALRSFSEWDQHPHAQVLLETLPVTIRKIGNAPKRQISGEILSRPLDGIRTLDLSRVLAGPIAGRTLAAHGADVLLVTSPGLPALPLLDIETSLGKRTCQLDLDKQEDLETLRNLTQDCDVFLQAYRPGGIESKGFGTGELAKLRPGIVCANLTAWGWEGPWKDRRGFDSLVQTATGFNVAEAEAYAAFTNPSETARGNLQPKPLPVQALDHAAGYLLAFGINAALCRTIAEGGSWEVRVSLAAVGQWIRSLGCLTPVQAFGLSKPLPERKWPLDPEIAELSSTWHESDGRGNKMTALRHPAVLSVTPAREGENGGEAPMRLDAHEAKWL